MTDMKMRGIRGAITVDQDDARQIFDATKRLLICMTEQNSVETEDITSILISVTDDLRSAFPALGLREMGWVQIPMLHFREIEVAGAMHRVIRVLMHVNTLKGQLEIEHVYLDGARTLRPDLSGDVAP